MHMPSPQAPTTERRAWVLQALIIAALFILFPIFAFAAGAGDLRAKYQELKPQLAQNQFGQPLVLDSTEQPNALQGEIYAVMEHPFAAVANAFKSPANWCDMLILHLNTKYCSAAGAGLSMGVGGKKPEPAERASRLDFSFNPGASSADYFSADLAAEKGPMSTSNYRIRMEAVPLPGNRTFLHLTYAYEYGMAGKLAMKTYLATAGSGKVGFTQVNSPDGATGYIKGVRGVVERNTMRYYLAIDAYLGAQSAPAAQRLEKRITAWYDATERYARQLHEVERGAYLEMKREEAQRQVAMGY